MKGKLTLLFLFSVMLVSCGQSIGVQATPTPIPLPTAPPEIITGATNEMKCSPAVVLTKGNNSQTITIQKGQSFSFDADTNVSTGYDWFATSFDNTLLTHDPQLNEYSQAKNLPGAGGQVRMCFSAMRGGQTGLEIDYIRPWEKGVKPVESFNVTVVIKE